MVQIPVEPEEPVQPEEPEEPQTGDFGLPRTGGAVDQLMLIITGCICLLAGVMLLTRRVKR